MSISTASYDCESKGPFGAVVDGSDIKFVIPRSWIYQDDEVEVITLQVRLHGCTKDGVKIKMWNKRQLLVLAAGQFHRYKFHYKIPLGAGLLSLPTFASQTAMLTCRFHRSNPVCAVCHTSVRRRPVATKDMFASGINEPSFWSIQPHHWITYDGTMALFEAHLEGCKVSSQINFHVANDKVVLAALSPRHHYFLDLRLESSAKCDWQAHFDQQMEMFTCTIPLLGHYECGLCMAKRHHDAAEASEEKPEKVVGRELKKAGRGCPIHTNGQQTKQSPCLETATSERDDVNLNKSCMKIFAYSETAI